MNGILSRISSTNNNLRTNEVDGWFFRVPTAGQSFYMEAPGLSDPGMLRQVTTSVVTEVNKISDNEFEFKTLNSSYKLLVTGELSE